MAKLIRVREFLNLLGHNSTASIYVDWNSDDGYPSIEVRDCDSKVVIEFDLETRSNRANSLYKARLLRDTFADFYDALSDKCRRMNRGDVE